MSRFSKAVSKMSRAGKKIKAERNYSADPKVAAAEKRLYDTADKVKKEGIS